MAGAGWRQFTVGQLLTSAQVQTYLQDQSVQVHASAAARSSALGTAVSAGMVSYRADDRALELYAGSAWQPVMQGRNAIINGAFDFWQRGTSTSGIGYLADRFVTGSTETVTTSQQTFSPGTPPFGYEAQYHARVAVTSIAGAGNFTQYEQRVEDVRTFSGQTVTFSYWAKADAAKSVAIEVQQLFGTGGSSTVNTFVVKQALSTSWQRYSHTFVMPSMTGKTIGAGSSVGIRWWLSAGSDYNSRTGSLGQQNITFDVWGVQLEAGSIATPFVRAATTLQGELAACQRYYQRFTADNGVLIGGHGGSVTGTIGQATIPLPVTMRANPTSIDFANISWYNYGNGVLYNSGSFVLQAGQTNYPLVRYTHGSSVFTSGQVGVFSSNATGGFLGFSAEL